MNPTEQPESPTTEDGERELVYRQGWGWVSRPVEVEPVEVPLEAPRREIAWVA